MDRSIKMNALRLKKLIKKVWVGSITFMVIQWTCILPMSHGATELFVGMSPLLFGGDSSSWSFLFGYDKTLSKRFQVGGRFKWTRGSAGELSFSTLSLIGAFTLNIGPALINNYYISIELGLQTTSSSLSETVSETEFQGSYGMLFGKRFVVTDRFTFRPNMGFIRIGSGGGLTFVITPLLFSYFL